MRGKGPQMERKKLSAGKFAAFHRNIAAIIITWAIIIAVSLTWNIHRTQQETRELAKKEAMATFNKDQAFILWAAKHGGVYVPPTEETPPESLSQTYP